MIVLPPETIKIDLETIRLIESETKAIYRLIIFSRQHTDDDLLNNYLNSVHKLQELLSIKNAQMEKQTDEEAEEYLSNLNIALVFITKEILDQRNFSKVSDLFQLLRLISPESHSEHPNRFRQTLVQVGAHICPPPEIIPNLIESLFYNLNVIENPIIKSIYVHHELVRIHPFSDGNGRVSRMAQNWMLMYDLFPPIFINDKDEKEQYISSLKNSFESLRNNPYEFSEATKLFFLLEINRLLKNTKIVYESIFTTG